MAENCDTCIVFNFITLSCNCIILTTRYILYYLEECDVRSTRYKNVIASFVHSNLVQQMKMLVLLVLEIAR